jgi:hypothetical protein
MTRRSFGSYNPGRITIRLASLATNVELLLSLDEILVENRLKRGADWQNI